MVSKVMASLGKVQAKWVSWAQGCWMTRRDRAWSGSCSWWATSRRACEGERASGKEKAGKTMATRVMCSCEEEEEDDDDEEDEDDDDEEWVVDLSAEVGVEGSLPRERRGTIDGLHWD